MKVRLKLINSDNILPRTRRRMREILDRLRIGKPNLVTAHQVQQDKMLNFMAQYVRQEEIVIEFDSETETAVVLKQEGKHDARI